MRPLISLGQVVAKHSRVPLKPNVVQRSSKRFSGEYVGYREMNYNADRPIHKHVSEIGAGIMWWWIGWHLMTDWRHLIGEFIWPQRSEWTDEELGVSSE